MASRTTLLETIASRLLARREELAEEMTERIRAGVAEFADFDGAELWGPDADPTVRISIDAFEPYLEAI